jgi:hypothetical protein
MAGSESAEGLSGALGQIVATTARQRIRRKGRARGAAVQHVAMPKREESIVISLARVGGRSCTTTFASLGS